MGHLASFATYNVVVRGDRATLVAKMNVHFTSYADLPKLVGRRDCTSLGKLEDDRETYIKLRAESGREPSVSSAPAARATEPNGDAGVGASGAPRRRTASATRVPCR